LHDPHAAALVEGDVDRLADRRLGSSEFDLQPVGGLEALDGFVRR
jgi:hypothetical protein